MVDISQFREHLLGQGLSAVSVESYLRDAMQFCNYLKDTGSLQITEAKREDVEGYCRVMAQRGLAAVSVQRKLASIKRLFIYLHDTGFTADNPAAAIQLKKRPVSRAKALSGNELEKLLSMPETRSVIGIRDKAMFALACATGVKVTELVKLGMEDLRLPEVRVSRRGGYKSFKLDQETCRCLEAYIEKRALLCPEDGAAFFVNAYGSSLSRQGIWKTLKRYADMAGLEGVTLETLRRSFAYQYTKSGNDIRSLKDMLGHSDVSTTRAYIKK